MKVARFGLLYQAIWMQALGNNRIRQILAEAEEGNLFTARIGETEAFRFHPLFREFLLLRLEIEVGAEAMKQLRISFAEAYVKSDHNKDAIDQFLAAGESARAVKLIEAEGKGLLHSGEYNILRDWLDRLGKDHVSAALNILDARLLIENGKPREALVILARTKKDLRKKDVNFAFDCIRAYAECLKELSKFDEAIDELIRLLEMKLDTDNRLEALYILGINYCMHQKDKGIEECLKLAGEIIAS